MSVQKEQIDKLKDMLKESRKVVFFTGAGISVPSGIPDFRSANGIYNEKQNRTYSPEEMVSHSFLYAHPEDFFAFYREKMLYPDAKPNAAHRWIAALQKDHEVTVVTQNIDGLHEAAGSENVVNLHGSVHENYCVHCRKTYPMEYVYRSEGVPKCSCGGMIRPNVVLYEEILDDTAITKAIRAIEEADMVVVIGTSLVVYPAASFIGFYRGDRLVLINLSETYADSYANLCINEDCEEVAVRMTEDL
ncbi:MAG: NAD-dependent protein deacylase [Lachnospiraceae bacterium]|nr:NAD-dependent protein deacylase [Lachnospiraceae bacterium]